MNDEKKKTARYGHKIRMSRYEGRPEDSRPQAQLPAKKSQLPVKSPPLEHGETCSHVDMQLDGTMPLNSAVLAHHLPRRYPARWYEWRR